MRYGVTLTPGTERAVTADEIAGFARHVESLGFGAIYLSDHTIAPYACFHSVAAANIIAGATERMTIGFSAYQVPLRHPIAVAKEFAMLDALSNGRLLAGFAVGSWKPEFDAYGIPFEQRGRIMDDALAAIKTLWTEDEARHDGPYFRFDSVRLIPKPVQQPHPPIWIGSWAASPRAADRIARLSDGWQASGNHSPIEALPQAQAAIDAACERIGRDPATVGRAYVNTQIHFAETADKAWDEFVALSVRNRDRDRNLGFIGDTAFIKERLAALAEAGMQEVTFNLGVDERDKATVIANELIAG
jgi:probable F420-dependent oxidoreductase